MQVAVHQPNYLPWSGFFQKMVQCDVLVLLDNVQYPQRDFCNRTRVKSPQGLAWLTLPVKQASFDQKIKEMKLFEPQKNLGRQMKTLRHYYGRAPYFTFLAKKLLPIFEETWEDLLSLNLALIKVLAELLGINTTLVLASSLGEIVEGKSKRIIYLCQKLGADTYLSGQGGAAYNDSQAFAEAGLELKYQNFIPPLYPQGAGPFLPRLSVFDLIAYTGQESGRFLDLGR